MAISFYDATVPNFVQTLGGVSSFMDRGFAHCSDNNIDPNDIVNARLFADMLPFRFQVLSTVNHSIGALEALHKGVFSPPRETPPLDYAALQAAVTDARAKLKALKPEDVNALEGRDMAFQFGEMKMPFTAETFIASFSTPNFYFHAATAYDILRMKGVPLGKRDFMGSLRMKR